MVSDLNDFLRLSASLNMQLCAAGVWRHNVMAAVLGPAQVSALESELLLDVLQYLDEAYGRRRRRVGSLSLLHPLRTAALLARAAAHPALLDLLTCLLHDKLEDITTDAVEAAAFEPLEQQFQSLLKRIDPDREWLLMERVSWLTRYPGQTYYAYIERLLAHVDRAPSVLAVKLADRLDNTLDLRIDVVDPIHGVDFFQTVFELLFLGGHRGYHAAVPHPPASPVNGAERLYQLFKNAVLLSMLSGAPGALRHTAAPELAQALATASMKEAQRIVLHIFAYHESDVRAQRGLLVEMLEQSQLSTPSRITLPDSTRQLDKLFSNVFEHYDLATRDENLARLYRDKSLMLEAALSFVIVFLGFVTGHAFPEVSAWRRSEEEFDQPSGAFGD